MNEFIGTGSIKNLYKILNKDKYSNVFCITGNSPLEQNNIDKILQIIKKKCSIFHYNDIKPTPTIEGVNQALDLFKKGNYDLIIAMGGGSVLDIGKAVSVFSTNKGKIEDFLLKKLSLRREGTPLILVPTTAGTGSEATHFAVIFINNIKYSLADEKLIYAKYVIVDPELTYSLPKKVTAYTGMDALSQAIESYWNINSTDESKRYAKRAIKLIMNNLVKAVHNPDKKSRSKMALAANNAGKAINLTKTTACHAISYPITYYFKVPHGHAVALTLPSMFLFNSEVHEDDVLDSRGLYYVKGIMKELISLLGVSSFNEAKVKINDLVKVIGLETRLSDLGIKTKEEIEIIIKNGFNPERVKNNPRLLTESQLRHILQEIR
ncbi:MAG: phosphonoacetaldehyde reductase [Candidatus Hermodarchaeota archaeon]